MLQWTMPSLGQIMVWCLFGTFQCRFNHHTTTFHLRKWMWEMQIKWVMSPKIQLVKGQDYARESFCACYLGPTNCMMCSKNDTHMPLLVASLIYLFLLLFGLLQKICKPIYIANWINTAVNITGNRFVIWFFVLNSASKRSRLREGEFLCM